MSTHEIADELAKIPPNHWAALKLDESEVIFSAPTLDEAIAGAVARGVGDPLLLKTSEWDLLIPTPSWV